MKLNTLAMSFCTLLLSIHLAAQDYQLSKPIVDVEGGGFFQKKTSVALDFRLEGASLHYTLDGSEPTASSDLYKRPLKIKRDVLLKVKAFKTGFRPSETVVSQLLKVDKKISSIAITPEPKAPYTGNGGATLIDQKAGSLNFRDGNWLGYNSGPITINLDLGKEKALKEVVLSMLNSPGSWIMPPVSIQYATSKNGTDFGESQSLAVELIKQGEAAGKSYYSLEPGGGKFRYVKLVIKPLSQLPDWHPGKGNAAWVFMDEIIIR